MKIAIIGTISQGKEPFDIKLDATSPEGDWEVTFESGIYSKTLNTTGTQIDTDQLSSKGGSTSVGATVTKLDGLTEANVYWKKNGVTEHQETYTAEPVDHVLYTFLNCAPGDELSVVVQEI